MSNDYGFGLTGPRIEKQYSNSNKPIDNPAELLALVNAEAGKGQETAVKALREKMPVERRSALLKQLTLNNLYDLVKKHGKTYDYGYMLGRDILRFMPQEHLRKLLTDLEKLVAGLQNNPKDEQNTKIAAKLSSIILGMIKDRSLPLTESQLQELGLSTETLEKLTYRLTPGVEAHYRNMNGQEEYKLFMDSDWVLHVG
ncbi:MAG: hypothetical protein LBL50_04460, partial [Candidatus Margulisbacteria bacterium]|nr:hypothetical protein [Candidatus Margulisiibacteriota bacterium]